MVVLPEFNNFEIEKLLDTELFTQLTIKVRAPSVECPLCSVLATRVQSRYIRTLTDLPAAGQCLKIQLVVRRFYCDNSGCLRRIFAERFPCLTRPFAQRTDRLNQTLMQIGMILGGEPGAALAKKLGMPISPDTLLRLLKATKPAENQLSVQEESPLTKIGIDDWSWKRGVNFGTIIVNLDTHKVVDLLPDRTSETVSKWLTNHPQLEVISRDRATGYALAATQGAPQALQVADRFHIVKNLAEQVELLLARLRKEWRPPLNLPVPVNTAENEAKTAKELPYPTTWKVLPSRQTERKRLARREERMNRYHQVIQLREAGLKQAEIAERTGISERTIRNLLHSDGFPEAQPRPKRHSIFDPYTVYVLQRWQEGEHDGHQLWLEIAAKGFKGKERTLQRFLQQLRDEKRQPLTLPEASSIESLKARKAVWWFIREPAKLK